MTLFEQIVAGAAIVLAFTRLYDWLEWQISQYQERRRGEA